MFWTIAGITALAAVICYALAYTVLKGPRKAFAKAMASIFVTMAILMALLSMMQQS